jgi:hypothetical protein
MTLTRRSFLGISLLALLNPSLCIRDSREDSLVGKVKSIFGDHNEEIETIGKFADEYMKRYLPSQSDKQVVNILYPGSGVDTRQLLMGLKFLHQSEVERVNFVYTEVGDESVAWYPGKDNLKSNLEIELDKYVRAGLLESTSVKVTPFPPVVSEGKEQESVEIEYSFDVNTPKGKKNITLKMAYNRAGNRAEPSAEEMRFFGKEFMNEVREREGCYWPAQLRPGVVYPPYASLEQFNAADIILSRMCGDQKLLQFDYLRAMLNPSVSAKPRVVFDEYANGNFAIRKTLPRYETRTLELGGSYGYNSPKQHKTGEGIGMVVFIPKSI